jgi:hypothetical protein
VGIVCTTTYRRLAAERALDQLRRSWGQEQDRKRTFPMIKALYRFAESSGPACDTALDDQTWNDLNMDEVYAKIDRTLTNPGECVLYQMLRTPLLCKSELARRGDVIRLFQNDPAVREKVQLCLQRLGRWDTNVITSLVWGQTASSAVRRRLYSGLALLAPVVAVGAPLLWGTRGILALLVVYAVNLLATRRVRAQLIFAIAALRYQSAMIATAQKIADLACPALAFYADGLKAAGRAARDIAHRTFLLLPESSFGSDPLTLLYAHVDIYFVRNVRIYHAVMEEMDRHRNELHGRCGEGRPRGAFLLKAIPGTATMPSWTDPYDEDKNKN